ncbi:unnamed protein product [Clonostachys rosea f. rosea IK726]|uniref:Uncharacterized protein n=1 Tax=Clonostachys rosea f. rosea IK726 TaxID=1349383 RepID=A0ACA9TMH0_BIOOC|nr:unnamed protein product [Clonostachys rosea f. rosea IK726]
MFTMMMPLNQAKLPVSAREDDTAGASSTWFRLPQRSAIWVNTTTFNRISCYGCGAEIPQCPSGSAL